MDFFQSLHSFWSIYCHELQQLVSQRQTSVLKFVLVISNKHITVELCTLVCPHLTPSHSHPSPHLTLLLPPHPTPHTSPQLVVTPLTPSHSHPSHPSHLLTVIFSHRDPQEALVRWGQG